MSSSERLRSHLGLSRREECTWRALIRKPDASRDELARLAQINETELDKVFEVLRRAELVRAHSSDCGFVATDPESAIEIRVAREEQRLLREREELSAIRSELATLSDEYAEGRASAGILPGFEIVTDLDDIRALIYAEGDRVQSEHRALLYGTKPEAVIHGREFDRKVLQRGVRQRSIVCRRDLDLPGLYEAVMWLHNEGEEVRTLETVPSQTKIFDRRLAVVRVDADDPSKGAMFIRVQNLVDLLIDHFERMWEDAEPLFPSQTSEEILSPRQARVLALMAAGTKDEAISRSLDIGLRTIRRDISELKEMTGAGSRTELVTAAIRRGWL